MDREYAARNPELCRVGHLFSMWQILSRIRYESPGCSLRYRQYRKHNGHTTQSLLCMTTKKKNELFSTTEKNATSD